MKIYKILPGLLVLSLFACSKKETKTLETTEADQSQEMVMPKTYAEIAAKEGGQWNGRKYEGGTFKNVDSLWLSPHHTDHSFDIRYEGPGWESDKVGYRLYLDWRNAIDIFGKKVDTLVLSQVGLDGFDSYHEMSGWGADILKVGKGLGIGSIGRYLNDTVAHFNQVDSTFAKVENSDKASSVVIDYYGWKTGDDKIDFSSILTIKPNDRYTKNTIQSSEAISGICTGIVKHNDLPLIQKESENKKWGYIATYGVQTLIPDKLGMAIFYPMDETESLVDGEFDHLIVFKPTTEPISFYFLGAWEQEKDGIKTQEEFVKYLNEKLSELNSNNTL
ncbi:MAG: DUF4861 family protein [Cyclobacteriaceae bacterium]|nr:DUF4861 family protein [Cyclobacteriaceae bacterium]